MASEEGVGVVPKSRVTRNLPIGECPIASASDIDGEPYIMPGLPKLDSMILRCSNRTPNPLSVVMESRI